MTISMFFRKDYFTLLPMSWVYLLVTWALCIYSSTFYTSSQYLPLTGHKLLFISSSKLGGILKEQSSGHSHIGERDEAESSLENWVIFHISQEKLLTYIRSRTVIKEDAEVLIWQWFFKHCSKCSGGII